MTRHIDSKIAIQTAATAPASIVNEITVSSPASHPSLANILLRPFRRAQIARELQSLDERMLRDIGVTKSEIDRVAAESVGGEEWVVVAAGEACRPQAGRLVEPPRRLSPSDGPR